MDPTALGQANVLGHAMADVTVARERARQSRLRRVVFVLVLIGMSLALRTLNGQAVKLLDWLLEAGHALCPIDYRHWRAVVHRR